MTHEENVVQGEVVFLKAVLYDLENLLGEFSAEQHTRAASMLLGLLTAAAKLRHESGVSWRAEQRQMLIWALGEKNGLDTQREGA